MWKLPQPTIDQVMSELYTAMTYKDGKLKYKLSPSEKADIQEIYDEYESVKGLGNAKLKGPAFTKETLAAMEASYGEVQQVGRLSKLRQSLLLNAGTCPCCGILPADELDHHLPKVDFKLLSIYPRNLVALCHKCNNKKRTVDGIDENKRFIHVYYDNVPVDVQFLFAQILIKGGGLVVRYEVKKIAELSELLYKQITFQTERVNFHGRIDPEVNIYLSSFAASLQLAYEGFGKAGVEITLKRAAEHAQKIFGLNHWRTVLLFGLAAYGDFCDGGFYEPLKLVRL